MVWTIDNSMLWSAGMWKGGMCQVMVFRRPNGYQIKSKQPQNKYSTTIQWFTPPPDGRRHWTFISLYQLLWSEWLTFNHCEAKNKTRGVTNHTLRECKYLLGPCKYTLGSCRGMSESCRPVRIIDGLYMAMIRCCDQ